MPKYNVWIPDDGVPWENERFPVIADDAVEAAEQVAEARSIEGIVNVSDSAGVIRKVQVDIQYRGHVVEVIKPQE